MRKFFDHSLPLLNPADMVRAFTKRTSEDLALPGRAVVVFNSGDLKRILNIKNHRLVDAWKGFKRLYAIDNTGAIIVNSYFGGPNIAATVEELSSFGVDEFIIWGYCGGIGKGVDIGDIIIAEGALREDGVSHHYMNDIDDIGKDAFAYSNWTGQWEEQFGVPAFHRGLVWSCDAIYRETIDKVVRHRTSGILAVEMEAASFYTVCRYRGVKGIAFLIVSDLLDETGWAPGFHTKRFNEGVKRLCSFMVEQVIK